MNSTIVRRLTLMVTTAVCGLAAASAPAHAGALVKSAGSCVPDSISQQFLRWNDPLSYTSVRGGSMEDVLLPGWTLSSASVVAGNEPFYIRAKSDARSLHIAPGGSVQTATMCVGVDSITLRFFARSRNGLLALPPSRLKVEVLVETAKGEVLTLPLGVLSPGTTWRPSLPLPVIADLVPLLPGSKTPMAFRFTPSGTSDWWIDDVYVDPRFGRR